MATKHTEFVILLFILYRFSHIFLDHYTRNKRLTHRECSTGNITIDPSDKENAGLYLCAPGISRQQTDAHREFNHISVAQFFFSVEGCNNIVLLSFWSDNWNELPSYIFKDNLTARISSYRFLFEDRQSRNGWMWQCSLTDRQIKSLSDSILEKMKHV